MVKENKAQVNAFKTIAKDDKAPNDLVINGMIANCTLTTKPDGDSPVRYVQEWAFDFSDCSQEDLIRLATATVKINMQSTWRKDQDYASADKWAKRTFNVKHDILTAKRTTNANPVQKAMSVIGKMTEEQRKQFLADIAKLG